jgi:hypothetical protein
MKKNIKKITFRYTLKKVNPEFYETIEIKKMNVAEVSIEKEYIESAYIYLPYTSLCVDKPSKEYKKFMRKYSKAHKVCPKCGSKMHSTTLVGYAFYSEKKEEYKDLNDCVCSKCGDKHTAHERISVKEFKKN